MACAHAQISLPPATGSATAVGTGRREMQDAVIAAFPDFSQTNYVQISWAGGYNNLHYDVHSAGSICAQWQATGDQGMVQQDCDGTVDMQLFAVEVVEGLNLTTSSHHHTFDIDLVVGSIRLRSKSNLSQCLDLVRVSSPYILKEFRLEDCLGAPAVGDHQVLHLSPFDDDNDDYVFNWAHLDGSTMDSEAGFAGGLMRLFQPGHAANYGSNSRWQMRDSGESLPWAKVSMNDFIFAGVEPDEALNPSGNFAYSLNVDAPGVTIPDVEYAGNGSAGELSVTTTKKVFAWFPWGLYGGLAGFEESLVDDNSTMLQLLVHSIRRTPDPTPLVVILTVTPGVEYLLQLIFHEQCCSRAVDVMVDGNHSQLEFPTGSGTRSPHVFVPQSTTVMVSVASEGESFNDTRPILNGLTLDVNHGSRILYPSPLVHRLVVDFRQHHGEFQVLFLNEM